MEIDSEPLSMKTLKKVEESIAELREGKFIEEEEIDKLLGI